jgi:CDP-glucose 4,6-dehydratase
LWLQQLGAEVAGFALQPATQPSAYELLQLDNSIASTFGDVRDAQKLAAALTDAKPAVIFHLASQAIVSEGLRDAYGTFTTNLIGVLNIIEAALQLPEPVLIVNVTSDKVYRNDGGAQRYTEDASLGGFDPYSASKACAELISSAYRNTVLAQRHVRISTARAGNVIGGGDWAVDRLIPDIVRAITAAHPVVLRHPQAVRPWQHVLEPLSGYLQLAHAMAQQGREYDDAWNFGPADVEPFTVAQLAEQMLRAFGSRERWVTADAPNSAEMRYLQIDSSKARNKLGWQSRLTMPETLQWTADWYEAWRMGQDMRPFTLRQIETYERKFAHVQ